MATGAHCGHIIKHLETSHIDALPIPIVDDRTAEDFQRRGNRILELRDKGHQLTLEAEAAFEDAIGLPKTITNWGERGFSVNAYETFVSGRRRMDATIHNPGVAAIRRHLAKNGQGFTKIRDAGYDVWLPTRFRRIPAADGVWLFESADLTEINPDLTKQIADGDFGDPHLGRVDPGWVLVARSGQTYGIIGTAMISGEDLIGKIISDHIMRLKPKVNTKLMPGYLLTAMSHPTLGRPLVKALAYGSSIPEIEVADIENHPIVRLKESNERAIAQLAEASAKARAQSDVLEREIAADAEKIIDSFIGV